MRRCNPRTILLPVLGFLPLTAFAVSLVTLPHPAQAQTLSELRAARKANYDAHAFELLKQMTEAYAHLTAFDQETEFYGLQTPVQALGDGKGISTADAATAGSNQSTIRHPRSTNNPSSSLELSHVPVEKPLGRTIRLIVVGNRLRLTQTEAGESNTQQATASTISDGKFLWVYTPSKNWYTQVKAPRKLRDFQRVPNLGSATLELLMLIGVNLFEDAENQFDAVKYEGKTDVRGVQTDVVLLRSESEKQTQELRLYIDADSALLRRLVAESKPHIAAIAAPPKHNPLDDLIARPVAPPNAAANEFKPEVAPGFEDPRSLAPPDAPMYVRITCENTYTLSPQLEPDTFVFKPPQGSSLYQDINGSGDFNKMSAPVSVQDMIKQQLKAGAQTSKSTKKSKPVRVRL